MRYTFEHLFIPRIVDNSNKEDFELDSVEIFDDFEFVGGCFSEYYPKEEKQFCWKDFSITKQMNYDVQYWVLSFPEPQSASEAKWGMIIKRENKPFIYFTLEMTEDDSLAFCCYDKGGHKVIENYPKETTKEDFVKLVLDFK